MLLIGVAAGVIALCLGGCGSKREESRHHESQEQVVEKETTTHQGYVATPDGQVVPVTEVTTRYREQVTKGQADDEIRSQTTIVPPPVLEAAIRVGGAVAGATPWGQIIAGITGAFGAAAVGYGAVQRTRAAEHKTDAAEGWAEALRNAKALPPERA